MENSKISFFNNLGHQGLLLPYSDDFSFYKIPLTIYGKTLPNRIGIQPLEGFDSNTDGSPSDMVKRRYLRFVNGGAGLIWFEACAVSEDGKCNPWQMALTKSNVDDFKAFIRLMDETSEKNNSAPTFKVLQLTHSGRMSRNEDFSPAPLAARKNYYEESHNEGPDFIASDERIEKMVAEHIEAARLAYQAGFDAVDIKVCHGYFLSELLSAFNRPGKYGGSFENRTRALFEIIDGINALPKKINLSVRLNAFDSTPAPYGYGIEKNNDSLIPNLSETIKICEMLRDRGVLLLDISASTPATRLFGPDPADKQYQKYASSTDLLTAVKLLKEKVPEITFMCTGLSAFGELGDNIGAGGIKDGWFDIAGFGRQALAYPDFANDILNGNGLDSEKCCIGCNSCYKLMNPGFTHAGCIVRDKDLYLPLYKEHVLNK